MKAASAGLAVSLAATAALAEPPLSAIDWLTKPAPITVAQPLIVPLNTAPVAEGVTVPDVTVMPLDAAQPDAVGLLPQASTGLPNNLWKASSTDTLVAQLSRLSDTPLPAIQALYYTLLLAEAEPPADAMNDARFLKARLETLRKYGAVDAARALIERAGPASPALFDTWFDLALLDGGEDAACAALTGEPDLTESYAARVYCIARTGDWPTAALTFDTAAALGALDSVEEGLLAQYLDPEYAEASVNLPPPGRMTPLLFRLHEAAGRPLPTGRLPRAYAAANLRGSSGWKYEIEAAERLTRSGALPANRLLGLYTEREPAASGGVWDRVAAVQAFDDAVAAGDADAVARALPEAWDAMRDEALEVAFAALYGDALMRLSLPDEQDLAFEISLLSPVYEEAAKAAPEARRAAFLAGLARGEPDPALARSPAEQAIAAAFAATGPAPDHAGPLAAGRLGQVILSAAAQLDAAGPNRTEDITAALQTLRAVGLEDVARRAALQILLLKRHG